MYFYKSIEDSKDIVLTRRRTKCQVVYHLKQVGLCRDSYQILAPMPKLFRWHLLFGDIIAALWKKIIPRPRGYKTFVSCSTQLSMGFIMLINIKMPTTIVGILTFSSMINTISEGLKARKVFIFQHFSFLSS